MNSAKLGSPLGLKKTPEKQRLQSKGAGNDFQRPTDELISNLSLESGYILLSFKEEGKGGISLTTKKNPPRPNPKNPEQGAAESALQLCKAKLS